MDDGSSDGSTAVALAHGAQVIENGGKGSSAARNAGMHAATGEFLLMVDDDDVALDGHYGRTSSCCESTRTSPRWFAR